MKTLLLAALAATLWAAPPDPVSWKLAPPAKPVKAGANFQATLTAAIEPGWHLYSLKPVAEGPIPTRIWVADGQPFKLAGAVGADDPVTVQDPALGMEVEMYEGQASFTLPLEAAAGSEGAQKLVVSASYQSCNNKLCLPPKTVRVELPL
ncbi:MAG: protein-disulfide reductase DsbD N-terminal domain-containing protein, partial [Acidobacteria bacterium]|nr:protein-disulfide reductase DsbD N-terminal domain-containing protein [Acidobacteriota bacterium]